MTTNIRLGQLWASTDWRDMKAGERQNLRVIDIQLEPPFDPRKEAWVEFHNEHTGKRTRVHVRRLRPNSTGYRLIKDVAASSLH